MESNLEPVSSPISQAQTQFPNKPLSGWGNLMAVLFIIQGGFLSMTIIFAIFGIPLIIAGVKLLKAVSVSKEITVTDSKTREMMANLNSFFKINGFLIIGGLVVGIISAFAIVALGLFAAIADMGNL